jgi:hypothetical protein
VQAPVEDVRDADFVAAASEIMGKIDWAFPGYHEVSITYRREGQLDLRIQFPLLPDGQCRLKVWFVPRGEMPIYDQLLAIRQGRPDIHAEEAVRMLKNTQNARSLPCDSSLVRLLDRAREWPVLLSTMPSDGVYLDSSIYTIDLRLGAMIVSASFPAHMEHPVASWTLDVREAVSDYIER